MVVPAQAIADVPRRLPELRQVLSDAEPAPRAGEDDRANLRRRASFSAAESALCSSALKAFRTSGRLSVIVKTASSRLVSTSAIA